MKKFASILVVMCLCLPAWASSVCLRNDTFVSVLRKSRDGLSHSIDTNAHKWFVNFDYITSTRDESTIYGFGVCSDTPGETFTANGTLSFALDEVGEHCWCQMGGPLVSDWVYYGAFDNTDACASGCVDACGSAAQTSSQFRGVLYDSVW